MSKNTRRRSIRLENLQNDSRMNLNHVTRSPKNSPNAQFKNNLQNRNKLDIKFTKVSKRVNDSNRLTQQSPSRVGILFGPKDNTNCSNDSDILGFPNTSNSITNECNQSNNINSSSLISNVFKHHISESSTTHHGNKNNSPDSDSTFYEPDSTVDDNPESDFIFDSNGPIDESVLTKNTKSIVPIHCKSSSDRDVTPKKNISVKKLTQHKPGFVKTNTRQKGKTVIKKTKWTNRKNSQTNSSQEMVFDEIDDISAMYSSHQNLSQEDTSNCKKPNSINKTIATIQRSNLKILSQHLLQTPVCSSPAINSKSTNCKSKPKNGPLVCKNPRTLKPNSKQRNVDPELFVSDHDSNQALSSNDLLLPSPDLTQLGHTSVCKNRLETPQDKNSASNAPVTNSSHHLKKTLRYPLRSIISSSPVIYDLPSIHRIRSNSSSVLSKFDKSSSKTCIASGSKITARKSITPKPCTNTKAQLQFSQCSSVHESLLDNSSTPQDTPNNVYDFVSTTPPRKPRTRTKKKKEPNSSQKARSSRSTPVKKPIQVKPNKNLSLSTSITNPRSNISTKKKTPTVETKTIFNTSAFSGITNQTPKKNNSATKNVTNKEGNFLNGMFPQNKQTPNQQKSMFSTPASSQTPRNFSNLNYSLNSPQIFFNRTYTPIQNQRNYSQTYGSLLAYIDNINHVNNDTEMDELCNLFSLLKISDILNPLKNSFSTYRDPCRIEKPSTKKIDKRCENPHRKISFLGNTFMNYRLSSKPIVEENETLFSPIPTKNSVTNGINFHQSEYVAGTRVSNDTPEDTNLSVRSVMKNITKISRKVPHYFYADGEYNFDGFSDWE